MHTHPKTCNRVIASLCHGNPFRYSIQQHDIILDWPGVDIASWTSSATATPCRSTSASTPPVPVPPAPPIVAPTSTPTSTVMHALEGSILARNINAIVALYATDAEIAVYNFATRTGTVVRGQENNHAALH